ncbi:hypothetical protein KR044_006594 [Drosophila immigrans]|nr:hypothetical protein KR044_006594 [Drosophila immigrans]
MAMLDKQQSQSSKLSKDAKESGSGPAQVRAPAQGHIHMAGAANVFKQLFATLEAEQQKLQQLEQRRIKLTEEMKTLRDMLQTENLRLRQSTPAAGSSSTVRKSILRIDTSKNTSQVGIVLIQSCLLL